MHEIFEVGGGGAFRAQLGELGAEARVLGNVHIGGKGKGHGSGLANEFGEVIGE